MKTIARVYAESISIYHMYDVTRIFSDKQERHLVIISKIMCYNVIRARVSVPRPTCLDDGDESARKLYTYYCLLTERLHVPRSKRTRSFTIYSGSCCCTTEMKRGFPSVGLSDSKLLDIYSYMLYAMREDPGPAPAGACSAGSFQRRTS